MLFFVLSKRSQFKFTWWQINADFLRSSFDWFISQNGFGLFEWDSTLYRWVSSSNLIDFSIIRMQIEREMIHAIPCYSISLMMPFGRPHRNDRWYRKLTLPFNMPPRLLRQLMRWMLENTVNQTKNHIIYGTAVCITVIALCSMPLNGCKMYEVNIVEWCRRDGPAVSQRKPKHN